MPTGDYPGSIPSEGVYWAVPLPAELELKKKKEQNKGVGELYPT